MYRCFIHGLIGGTMATKSKSIYSNYALVGSDYGNILFKKENNSVYFRNPQKSILHNTERRFDHLLKWIFDKKELLGIELTVM